MLLITTLLGILVISFYTPILPRILISMPHPDRTTIIVYNRVPKTGSTLMLRLLKSLSSQYHKFSYEHSSDYFHQRLSPAEQIQLAMTLTTYNHNVSNKPLLYDRHFYFFPISSTLEAEFKYINMVRDPLERTRSTFEYLRYLYFSKPHRMTGIQMLPSTANMTMEQCIHS